MKKNRKSFWPYGITIAIIAVVIMGAGTILVALKHPVQMDEAYMKKYQMVDNHINEIKKSQELFDEQYKLSINTKSFCVGKNRLFIDVVDRRTNRHADNLTIKVKITRPNDDQLDIRLNSKDNGKVYEFPEFEIKKEGRWMVLVEASNGKVQSYFKKEIDTK